MSPKIFNSKQKILQNKKKVLVEKYKSKLNVDYMKSSGVAWSWRVFEVEG
jgi:hypothetical protein